MVYQSDRPAIVYEIECPFFVELYRHILNGYGPIALLQNDGLLTPQFGQQTFT
jgi:hypothetical protein